jgi:hypothetical protein
VGIALAISAPALPPCGPRRSVIPGASVNCAALSAKNCSFES